MDKKIYVHGAMLYECRNCGNRKFVFLEKGLEDQKYDKEHPGCHKPVPFVIGCDSCKDRNGAMIDISGVLKIPNTENGYEELPIGQWYFANIKKYDCGVLRRNI